MLLRESGGDLMNKINVKMKKTAYLDLSILDVSKTAIYEYWCNYAK